MRGRILHPTPTAWDFFFGTGQACYVLFHLKSGNMIGGLYGTNSFTSSYPCPEQMYVEQLWRVNEQGQFLAPVDGSLGAVINHDECHLIEFMRGG